MRPDPEAILQKASCEIRDGLPVLHLGGTAYEIGYQHGALRKSEIHAARKRVLRYFENKIVVPGVSQWVVRRTLNRAWRKLAPFVPEEYLEEMQGLADGAGIAREEIYRLHAIPDLYSTLCANGVFFGEATADGRLYHLRNLDWNQHIGIQNFAALFAIEKDGKIPFVHAGYLGFIGALTGLNQEGISIGQVGAENQDETLEGFSMPLLIRKVLEESKTLEEAVRILKESQRTVGINYVIGSAKEKKAAAVETTAQHAAVFYDDDPNEKKVSYALPVKGAVFRADPAMDPVIRELQRCARGNPKKPGIEIPFGSSAYNVRYREQGVFAKKYYGKLNAERLLLLARSIAPRSNIQSVLFAYPELWVANAKGEEEAVRTEYVRFNLKDLLDSSGQKT